MADQSGRIMVVTAVISGLSAIVSAGIAAWVSVEAHSLQTEIVQIQSVNAAKLEAFRAENQQAITHLQEETKRSIAESEASLAKAQVFASLIESLSVPEKAGFALLALWQLNPSPEGQNLTIAAALGAPEGVGVRALKSLALVEDVGDRVRDVLAKAEEQNNTTLAFYAKQVIGKADEGDLVNFTLENVLQLEDYRISPANDFVETLIKMAKSDDSVRNTVKKARDSNPNRAPILDYVLYEAGEPSALDALLGPVENDPARFSSISSIVRFGRFDEADKPRIVALIIEALNQNSISSDHADAIGGLRWIKWDAVPEQQKAEAVRLLEAYAAAGESEYGRADSLEILGKIDESLTLDVISDLLAKGEDSNVVRGRMQRIVDKGAGLSTALRAVFDSLDLPSINAPAEDWQAWRAQHSANLRAS